MANDAIERATERRVADIKVGDMVDWTRNDKEHSGVVQVVQKGIVVVLDTNCVSQRVSRNEITRVY